MVGFSHTDQVILEEFTMAVELTIKLKNDKDYNEHPASTIFFFPFFHNINIVYVMIACTNEEKLLDIH